MGMECHELLRLLLCLAGFSWVLAAADVAPAGRHPGCRTRCGGVDIPYPYGTTRECAIHGGFVVNCTSVNGTAKLLHGTLEVTNISVPKGKTWFKTTISSQCYDPETGRTLYHDAWARFTNTPYWLSHDDNKIVVIGCNALAYMRSSSLITGQNDQYVIGCSSTCGKVTPTNGSCFGAGCCQADIPNGIRYYQGYFNENYNTTKNWRQSPCNYVAIMETAAFNFSTSYLTSRVFSDTYKGKVPVVLDWTVSWDTCEATKKNTTSYACVSSNSDCVDATNGRGYRCKCSDGYQGNPYISDGCKDIDECTENIAKPCQGICTNTPGGYICACPRGKHMIDGICKEGPTSWITPVVDKLPLQPLTHSHRKSQLTSIWALCSTIEYKVEEAVILVMFN